MERELIVAFVVALVSPVVVELAKMYPRFEGIVTNINGLIAIAISLGAWLALEPGEPYWPWFLAAGAGGLLGAQRYEAEKRIRQAREVAEKMRGAVSQ